MRQAFVLSAMLVLIAVCPHMAHCEDNKFPTKYSTIHYVDEKDFVDFIWKISGTRSDLIRGTDIAANRVDRIVDRVRAILDMWPENFSVDIYVIRGEVSADKVAYYDHKTRSIYVSLANVSEGMFAHEVAHAIIDQYFKVPPPIRTGEILTQYVDKYLWSDY